MAKKLTVFGSTHWPSCEPLKEYLSKNYVQYDYIDITESMRNLKIFLKFRDMDPFFDNAKKRGNVGIPVIMINNGEKFIGGDSDIDIEDLKWIRATSRPNFYFWKYPLLYCSE